MLINKSILLNSLQDNLNTAYGYKSVFLGYYTKGLCDLLGFEVWISRENLDRDYLVWICEKIGKAFLSSDFSGLHFGDLDRLKCVSKDFYDYLNVNGYSSFIMLSDKN